MLLLWSANAASISSLFLHPRLTVHPYIYILTGWDLYQMVSALWISPLNIFASLGVLDSFHYSTTHPCLQSHLPFWCMLTLWISALLAISAVPSSAGAHPRQSILPVFCFWIVLIHVLVFPEFIPNKELAPVKDVCVYMLGGTLLFGFQWHSQEISMLTWQTPFAGQSLGLNSPMHWILKNQSALRAEIQSQGIKTDWTPVYKALYLGV